MSIKFYLAAGSRSADDRLLARLVIDALARRGWECVYEWITDWERVTLPVACQLDRMGVRHADVVVGLIPGYRGTWWELGLADAWGKRMALIRISSSDADNLPFYYQDNIVVLSCLRGMDPLEAWAERIAEEALKALESL